MRPPHTACRQNKRVTIVLRDGRRVDGKFAERNDRVVKLSDGTVVSRGELAAFIVTPVERVNVDRRAENQARADKRRDDERRKKENRSAKKKGRR